MGRCVKTKPSQKANKWRVLSCDSNAESELQWQIPRGWLEWCLDQRDLVSIYVLCPSSLLVANLKPEGLEVLEYIGMSDKRIC